MTINTGSTTAVGFKCMYRNDRKFSDSQAWENSVDPDQGLHCLQLPLHLLDALYSTSLVVPNCYLFLLSVFILWFSYYVSDIFCKF